MNRAVDTDKAWKKLALNHQRNGKQDQTDALDEAAAAFCWEADAHRPWCPEAWSLLAGTALWDAATETQRLRLNQLYWVAYHSQIISAEIATIYFNQTSAAALYAVPDFRPVADTLDLESRQERAHIAAFHRIGTAVETHLFGRRVFTFPMRGPFEPTMIYSDLSKFRQKVRRFELAAFGLLSAGSAFIGSQYFTVRGLRTLNGKMVQSHLSGFYRQAERADADVAVPTRVSWHHFQDESFHFNTSALIGRELVAALPSPTAFERHLVNRALAGCQDDHTPVSVTLRGLFWHDPAAFDAVLALLESPVFGMSRKDALHWMTRIYGEPSEALAASHAFQDAARADYAQFLADLPWVSAENRELARMARSRPERTLAANRAAIARFVAARA